LGCRAFIDHTIGSKEPPLNLRVLLAEPVPMAWRPSVGWRIDCNSEIPFATGMQAAAVVNIWRSHFETNRLIEALERGKKS
jgi:hypothetical protein